VATLESGEMVTSSLRLVRRLGAGGMGTVWIARHTGLNADVVVKFITSEHAPNPDIVARFQREAAAAAEVRSPHVVQMLDHGVSQGGLPYIAMELLDGEDLAARVLRQRLSPGEIAGVVVQVARALSRAHERQIVHRDIKPENIFLCETGDEEAFVKVLDFGIAKVTKPEQFGGTATGAMIGTPYYMSPEQVIGAKTIDYRSDIWSLGVVVFYAMTGVHAFDGETIGAISVKICSGETPKPSHFNPTIPSAVDEWFATACAKDPAHRFQSVRAMAEALANAAGGRAAARIQARSSSGSNPIFEPQAPIAQPEAQRTPLPPTISSEQPAQASSAARLNSTTGPSSVSPSSTIAGVPKRGRMLPFVVAGFVAVAGVGVFFLTRGDGSSGTPKTGAPTASTEADNKEKPTKKAEPVEEPTAPAKSADPPTTDTTTKPEAPKTSAVKPATTGATKASAAMAATATSTASAIPSTTTSTKKPTLAKPKPTDEIIE